MIEQHRCLQVEWFQQPQSGFRLGRYPPPMESSLTGRRLAPNRWLAMTVDDTDIRTSKSLN
jgi:hypothetical protein